MYKFGLKLWSTNRQYISDAISLYEKRMYDYIELFVVPESFKDYISLWENLNIPCVIHAPHSATGLNLSRKEYLSNNIKLADQAKRFADALDADIIIFHSGIDGKIGETILQLKTIFDERIVIENKPYYGIFDGLVCVGNSPQEIAYIMNETSVGFCLDIGHAIYSANAKKIDPISYIKEFAALSPKIYHVSDGDYHGVCDKHQHFGDGNFDIKKIFHFLPKNIMLSVETEKSFQDNLQDFEQDIIYLKNIGVYDVER